MYLHSMWDVLDVDLALWRFFSVYYCTTYMCRQIDCQAKREQYKMMNDYCLLHFYLPLELHKRQKKVNRKTSTAR